MQELWGGAVLLDADFRADRFEESVREQSPSVVHVASHAVFTGDPDSSFLLTHDGAFGMERLADVVSPTRRGGRPVEMLVLSACETASGNERAALGLAGVAIRAGARSAIGSLWPVSDRATQELIVSFYTELGKSELSRAEALRRAQAGLLVHPRLRHPYYWSPFLLISNWL